MTTPSEHQHDWSPAREPGIAGICPCGAELTLGDALDRLDDLEEDLGDLRGQRLQTDADEVVIRTLLDEPGAE